MPDECERQRVSVDRTLVIACPRGDADGLLIRADFADLCAYDTVSVNTPKFAVARRAAGSNLALWSSTGTRVDTAVSYSGTIDEFYISARRWSGHGSVYFDVYAGTAYLGRTPDIQARSLDLDSLVAGAVDAFDVRAVVARYGQTGLPWFDLDNDGVIGPGDSTVVADHVTDGVDRPLLAPNAGETFTVGDTILIEWVPGEGDSARATLRLERDSASGYETIAQDIPDSGEMTWVVNAPDAPGSDYRVRIIRSAGVKADDDSNVYDQDRSDGPFTIGGGSVGVESSAPLTFALYPGRPNPGRHSVSFRFDLPVEAGVQFEIFDLQGRSLRRFMARYAPGRHEWIWDLKREGGRRVGAGMYFCRFTAGPFTGRNKMVVLP